jgi:hypothetical protein
MRVRLRGPTADVVAVALLIGMACVLMAPEWGGSVEFRADGLYYEAQKRELLGEGREESLHGVFEGPLAARARAKEADREPETRRYSNPEFVDYSARFYRRRWSVPAMAAAADPVLGEHSLEAVSQLGYLLLGPVLFALLRRRFDPVTSFAVAGGCLLLEPVREHSDAPMTDSWGLLLVTAGLLLAMLVLERGWRWLPLWVLAVLVLSVTRDLTIVLFVAAAWIAFRERTRRAAWLAGTGLAASIPAPLIFGAAARENLASIVQSAETSGPEPAIPTHTSWGYIIEGYPRVLGYVAREDLEYPFTTGFVPLTMLTVGLAVAGLVYLFLTQTRGDRFLALHRAAVVGGLVTVLASPNFTGLRLELALLPPAAVGAALAVSHIRERLRTPAPGVPAPSAGPSG